MPTEDIAYILKDNGFITSTYTVHNNKVIVHGSLKLDELNLTSLPNLTNFTIEGDFSCVSNLLESLKGAPEIVFGGFNCILNSLHNLNGVPKIFNLLTSDLGTYHSPIHIPQCLKPYQY